MAQVVRNLGIFFLPKVASSNLKLQKSVGRQILSADILKLHANLHAIKNLHTSHRPTKIGRQIERKTTRQISADKRKHQSCRPIKIGAGILGPSSHQCLL